MNPNNTVQLFDEVSKMPLYWANLLAKEKIVINPGGTYSGKTQSLVRVCLTHACMNYLPNGIIICTGTLTKLKEDAISIFEGIYSQNKVLASFIKSYNRTEFKAYFKNGTTIKFTSYENMLQAEGAKCDILYICEAPRLSWDIAYRLIFRTNIKVYMDYNPYAPFWVDDKIINCKINERTGQKEFNSVKVLRSWHIHNNFINDDKRQELENISDPDMWAVYARGLRGKLKGLIYPRFTLVDEIPPNCTEIIWGLDYGYTSDSTAIIKIGVRGNDRFAKECMYKPCDIAPEIKQCMVDNGWNPVHSVFSEHDKRIIFELISLGMPVYLANKKNKVSGIAKTKQFNIFYTQDSENFNTEINGYKWATFTNNTTGTEEESTKPIDGNDHCMDAFMYAVNTHAIMHNL